MSNSEAEPVEARAPGEEWFESFRRDDLARLRLALISALGVEVGGEAAADAVEYAWEHRERLADMVNPVGYLFRVGQSSGRRYRRRLRSIVLPPVSAAYLETVDPELPRALRRLSDRQRVAVVLVHVNGWTHDETAEAMAVDVSTVRTHVARALDRLRALLEEDR
jgi:RNA polymerase sigma factor (sigma-70 family)